MYTMRRQKCVENQILPRFILKPQSFKVQKYLQFLSAWMDSKTVVLLCITFFEILISALQCTIVPKLQVARLSVQLAQVHTIFIARCRGLHPVSVRNKIMHSQRRRIRKVDTKNVMDVATVHLYQMHLNIFISKFVRV